MVIVENDAGGDGDDVGIDAGAAFVGGGFG